MVQILFNATNDAVKCTECPKQVQMNAVFLIDLRCIPLDYLRADGLPQYDNYDGKRTVTIDEEDDDNGELKVAVISCEQAKLGVITWSVYTTAGMLNRRTSFIGESCMYYLSLTANILPPRFWMVT